MSKTAETERAREDAEMERLMTTPARNPRYAGATPKDVMRRLFRPVRRELQKGDRSEQ